MWSNWRLLLQIWLPDDGDLWALNLEQQVMHGEPVSNVLYFIVLTCCAPIWEEVSHSMCWWGVDLDVCESEGCHRSVMHISARCCWSRFTCRKQAVHASIVTIYLFATGNVQRFSAAVSQKVHAHVCISAAHLYCVCNASFQLATVHTFGSPWAYSGYSLLVFEKFGCPNHVA